MTWQMYAGRDRHNEGGFQNFGLPRYVEMHGHSEIVPVTLTEDPEGTYYGWLGSEHLRCKADTEPQMIQPRKSMFDMQFPYNPEAEVKAGKGRIVRLTVTETA